jgi:integrase
VRIDLVGTTADFRGFGPRPSLPINHLLGKNRGTAGRIGEVGLVSLRWDQVNFDAAAMRIYRAKHGRDATHPIPAGELGALKRLKRETTGAEFVFISRLGGPMTPRAFAQLLAKAAMRAGLPEGGNPHALRHACGYKLASEGRDLRVIQHYLGHRDVRSTEIYAEAAPADFRGLFR